MHVMCSATEGIQDFTRLLVQNRKSYVSGIDYLACMRKKSEIIEVYSMILG